MLKVFFFRGWGWMGVGLELGVLDIENYWYIYID